MTLGEIVRKYREEHNISQRQFAEASGLSNGYISMLEKNINPKTGLPMASSLGAMKKLAAAMNISVNDLIDRVDDTPIELTDEDIASETPTVTDSRRLEEFMELFDMLPSDKQALVIKMIKGILTEQ